MGDYASLLNDKNAHKTGEGHVNMLTRRLARLHGESTGVLRGNENVNNDDLEELEELRQSTFENRRTAFQLYIDHSLDLSLSLPQQNISLFSYRR